MDRTFNSSDYLNPNLKKKKKPPEFPIKLNTKFQIPYCGCMFLAISSFLILFPLSPSPHYNPVLLSFFPQDTRDSLLFLELTKLSKFLRMADLFMPFL